MTELTSAVCDLSAESGRLSYRGYDVRELAEHSSFEETTFILLHGYLPDRQTLKQFSGQLRASRRLSPAVLRAVRALPSGGDPMALLIAGVAAMGLEDPSSHEHRGGEPEGEEIAAIHLVGQVGSAVAAIHRLRSGQRPLAPRGSLGLAAGFLYLLHGEPPHPAAAKALDVALILRADNELNPSTYAARVATSTGASTFAAVISALGALSGPRHGGHTVAVARVLEEIGTPERARSWLDGRLAAGGIVPGFGHPVYKGEDPRVSPMRHAAQAAAVLATGPDWCQIATELEAEVRQRTPQTAMVDFYLAPLYHALGIPVSLFPAVFAVSRISGWLAHIQEQRNTPGLIRPRAQYVGPTALHYIPVRRRKQ